MRKPTAMRPWSASISVLVRQQLDDDDGARERQGDCHVCGGERVHAHRDGNQEPDDRRDHDWPTPVASATGPSVRMV